MFAFVQILHPPKSKSCSTIYVPVLRFHRIYYNNYYLNWNTESTCCNGGSTPKPPKPVKEKKEKPKKEKKSKKDGEGAAAEPKDKEKEKEAKSSGKDKDKEAQGSKPASFQVNKIETIISTKAVPLSFEHKQSHNDFLRFTHRIIKTFEQTKMLALCK